jgi:chorismate mutase
MSLDLTNFAGLYLLKKIMTKDLDQLRREIYDLDEELLSILAARYKLSKQVGALKFETGDEVLNRPLFDEKLKKLTKLGKSQGLPSKTVRRLWRNIHHESTRAQKLEIKRLKNHLSSVASDSKTSSNI